MVRETIASAIFEAACAHAAAPAAPAPANTVAPPPLSRDRFAPQKLRGPYRSPAEYCGKGAEPATFDVDVDSPYCALDVGAPTAEPVTVADTGPFRRVDVFARVDPEGPFRRCQLEIETVSGWYVDPDALHCHEPDDQHGMIARYLYVEPFVGDHDLVVGLSDAQAPASGGVSESFLLCEIGRSGVPSCTPPIPTVTFDYDLDTKVAITVRAEPGAITLSAPEHELAIDEVPTDWHEIVGRHELVFP